MADVSGYSSMDFMFPVHSAPQRKHSDIKMRGILDLSHRSLLMTNEMMSQSKQGPTSSRVVDVNTSHFCPSFSQMNFLLFFSSALGVGSDKTKHLKLSHWALGQ